MNKRKSDDPKADEAHEPPADPGAVRDVIEHTDSGSGRSQKDHWPAGEHDEAH